jgi:hypothetical protein
VYERGRSKRVARTETRELPMGQRSQFGVDDRKQLIQGVAIALAD